MECALLYRLRVCAVQEQFDVVLFMVLVRGTGLQALAVLQLLRLREGNSTKGSYAGRISV